MRHKYLWTNYNYCIKEECYENRVVNNDIWTVNIKGGLSTVQLEYMIGDIIHINSKIIR